MRKNPQVRIHTIRINTEERGDVDYREPAESQRMAELMATEQACDEGLTIHKVTYLDVD
jgi:hypothetical protein